MRISAREPDVLLSAATPIAEHAEMHATVSEGDMMRMRPIEQLALAAGETVRFEPGGRHFMLIDVRAPQSSGASFPLTLHFKNAGEIVTQVPVQAGGQ
jgi:copper(I)-binding protein